MSDTHIYSIANDTLNGVVDIESLDQAIRSDPAITTALEGTPDAGISAPDALRVHFKVAIGGGEKTALDSVVANHPGVKTVHAVKVLLDEEHTASGRLLVSPNLFEAGSDVAFIGQGDDVANGLRMEGSDFAIKVTTVETGVVMFQFIETVRLVGGKLIFDGAVSGDHASFEICAPATVAVSNPGSGVYGKLAVAPGLNMYVPGAMPGADGPDWDIDLTEELNANVSFSKAVPVPASGGGFFNLAGDEYSDLVFVPGMTGKYNLFDADIRLARLAHKIPMLGTQTLDMNIPAVVPRKIIPHYVYKVSFRNSTIKDLQCGFYLILSRDSTQ